MELKIAHLYGDIMNVYGDSGNIATLLYRARARQIAVSVTVLSVGDALAAEEYDLYFFGGGQDAGQEIVAADLARITPVLRAEVERGCALLSVCGGYQLLGQSYETSLGHVLPGASILPVNTLNGPTRLMQNVVIALAPSLDINRDQSGLAVGFENHSGRTTLTTGATPLGRVIVGGGNNGLDGTEGVLYRHAIGTYLHGSCLPKNPHLADWLLTKALLAHYGPVVLLPLDDAYEWAAHRRASEFSA